MTGRVVVNGAAGRMGRLVTTALRRAGCTDVVGCDPAAGEGTLRLDDGDLRVVADLGDVVGKNAVVVDFSHADCTDGLVDVALRHTARLVIGTTGQSPKHLERLRAASVQVPVLLARNFSLGINRLAQVLPMLRVLVREGFDVECIEAHHRQKKDAPSGTAKMLLERLLGDDPPSDYVHGRSGSETQRHQGEVGVHSLRAGQIPGDHTLVFAGEHEVLEVHHRALDRAAFVSGVVPAVRWVRHSPPGFFSMLDVMRDDAGRT